jgi:hypothetical protein
LFSPASKADRGSNTSSLISVQILIGTAMIVLMTILHTEEHG